jgi:thioredoxin reductase (NADPH)
MESLAADLRQMVRTPLHEAHVEALAEAGTQRTLAAGEMLAEPGQRMDCFVYLLSGEVEIVDPDTGQRALPHTLGPGQFAGDIAFLYGGTHSLPLRAAHETRVIEVPRARMLELMARTPEMSDIVITVMAARRRRMIEDQRGNLHLLGAGRDPQVRRIAEFAHRNRIAFAAHEDDSEQAAALRQRCGLGEGDSAVVFGRDQVIEAPTPLKIARLLGLDLSIEPDEVLDVLIVGGGPAGVAAAVYAGAEGLKGLVLEDVSIGGQAGTSSRIENYMGFPTGISGADLVWRGEVQAMKFGTRFAMPRRVTSVAKREDGTFCVKLDGELEVCARAVVIASGVQYRRLPIEGLERLEGCGVYYAATDIEARLCRESDVYVIGGGNSAGQAAMFLSRSARHVHVLVRSDSLAESMSDYLRSRLEADPRITLHFRHQVRAVEGEDALQGLRLHDLARDAEREAEAGALFVMVGAAPNTDWLDGLVKLDDKGFVLTGSAVGQDSPYACSEPGVFAVGDVRAGSVKRVASAVGEGSVVISAVWQHLFGRR